MAAAARRHPAWRRTLVGVTTEGLPLANYVSDSPVADRNAYRLYADLLWSSVFVAVVAFNGAFAVRLGASNELVGLLNSLPFLVVALVTMPFSRIVDRTVDRVRLVSIAVLLHRAGFLLIAAMPFVFLTHRAEAFVAIIILMTVPAALVNVTFNCVFADIVPERNRATVVAGRMIISSGVVMALTPLYGKWLDGGTEFPLNYQIIYLLGFLSSVFAFRALGRIETTTKPVAVADSPSENVSRPLSARLHGAWLMVAEQKPFRRILLNTLIHTVGFWIASPLYVIYYVRYLGAPDSWIGIQAAVASLAAVVGYELWRRIIVRIGEGLPLRLTIVMAAFFPVAVSLTQDLSVILILSAINGLIQPGLNTSHYSTLLRTCPRDRMPTFISIYITAMNAGAFVGPLIGVSLIPLVGVNAAIALGGAIWLMGGLLFWLMPVIPNQTSVST